MCKHSGTPTSHATGRDCPCLLAGRAAGLRRTDGTDLHSPVEPCSMNAISPRSSDVCCAPFRMKTCPHEQYGIHVHTSSRQVSDCRCGTPPTRRGANSSSFKPTTHVARDARVGNVARRVGQAKNHYSGSVSVRKTTAATKRPQYNLTPNKGSTTDPAAHTNETAQPKCDR